MILSFLSVSIISGLAIGIISNYYYSSLIKEDFNTLSHLAVRQFNYHLDYFKQMQRSTATLIQDDLIQGWLQNPGNLSDAGDIQLSLRRYMALNYPEVQDVILMSTDKKWVSITQLTGKTDQYNREPWYELPLQRKEQILPTHRTTADMNNGKNVISLILPVFNPDNMELLGRLIIEISTSEIDSTLGNSYFGSRSFLTIVADDGTVVYDPKGQWSGMNVQATPLSAVRTKKDEAPVVQPFNGERMLIAENKSTGTQWNLISMIPFSQMSKELIKARNTIIGFFIFIAILTTLLVLYLSSRIVSPILQLCKSMSAVSRGDFDTRMNPVQTNGELQLLSYGFNAMMGQLKQLMDTNVNLKTYEVRAQLKQKEAIINALQNQINPHLLYNTLGIIQSLAFTEKVPVIEKLACDLADIYRYTAKFSNMEIKLADEIRHVQTYFEIIHLRFPKYFQSYIYVNEKYMEHQVVKLIIQPIVENAVKYSIEPRGGSGSIIVTAYEEYEDLIIEIADNGTGIEEELMSSINGRLLRISENAEDEYIQEHSLGLGITNVHARMVLQYGKRYGVSLSSFVGRGTVVSLRMPLIQKN
jgi:two-component system sensor histidine kinase YesM